MTGRNGSVSSSWARRRRPRAAFSTPASGLYRAVRDAFEAAFPARRRSRFLDSFRSRGCDLVDLGREPVDRLEASARRPARREGEPRLARLVRRTRPEVVIVVVRSIAPNVRRALDRADWSGRCVELANPGRWKRHRDAFVRDLPPIPRAKAPARRNLGRSLAYPPP